MDHKRQSESTFGHFQTRRRIPLSLAVLILIASLPGPSAAYSYRNPFHSQECTQAMRAACHRLAREEGAAARLLYAEALLCRGVEDDAWALVRAIAVLEDIVVQVPENFFAQLDLADALRKYFPISEEALQALRRAKELLGDADVGAARTDLSAYISENLEAVQRARAALLPVLRERKTAFETGRLSSREIGDYLAMVARTGQEAQRGAVKTLDLHLARNDEDGVIAFYRAEILPGVLSLDVTRDLYALARERLCSRGGTSRNHQICLLIRVRLRQLAAVHLRAGCRLQALPHVQS